MGLGIAVACAVFVVRRIQSGWDETNEALRSADLGWVVASVGLAALGMVAIALPWRRVLGALGVTASGRVVISYYFLGEIGKYLPGGIWPIVGRGELIAKADVPRRSAYASVLLSLATLYLAALFVATALVPAAVVSRNGSSDALWLVLLLPLGLGALHPRILGSVITLIERVVRREIGVELPSWTTMLLLVAFYIPAWLLIGSATWALSMAFGGGGSWPLVCATTALSWAAGFLVAPVPGGIGVREAVFVAAVPGLPDGIAAIVAVTARLVFIAVDGIGALLGGAAIAATRSE